MTSEKFEIYVPIANDVKLIIRDLENGDEYILDMEKSGEKWFIEIPNFTMNEAFLYYYLVDNNFVLTDIVERMTDKNSFPKYSEIRKALRYCCFNLNITHVNVSKSLSQYNKPIGLSKSFNSLNDSINVIYYYEKPKHNLNVKIALTKNNKILNMSDIQIKKNSSKILYVIEINEKLDTGVYNLVLFNNKRLLNEISIEYKKLVTYNNIIGDYNLKLNIKGVE